MREILDEEILEPTRKGESNLHWRALTYIVVMSVGGLLYGRFFMIDGAGSVATALSFLLVAMGLMLLVEVVKWAVRTIRNRDLELQYPIWFELTENTMGYWVWTVALSMMSRMM
ncbi:MAG: hypothetical protein AAF990_05255 [Bacteroidota bacterium]